MKSYTVIGAAYDADFHCLDCARARFGAQIDSLDWSGLVDSEGNPVHPVFAGDETTDDEYCGDCREKLLD